MKLVLKYVQILSILICAATVIYGLYGVYMWRGVITVIQLYLKELNNFWINEKLPKIYIESLANYNDFLTNIFWISSISSVICLISILMGCFTKNKQT